MGLGIASTWCNSRRTRRRTHRRGSFERPCWARWACRGRDSARCRLAGPGRGRLWRGCWSWWLGPLDALLTTSGAISTTSWWQRRSLGGSSSIARCELALVDGGCGDGAVEALRSCRVWLVSGSLRLSGLVRLWSELLMFSGCRFEVVSSLGAGEDGVRCSLVIDSMCRSARHIYSIIIY